MIYNSIILIFLLKLQTTKINVTEEYLNLHFEILNKFTSLTPKIVDILA